MKNVKIEIRENRLYIEVDLSEEVGLSSSGKSILVASTEGPAKLEGREERVGLNVYKPF